MPRLQVGKLNKGAVHGPKRLPTIQETPEKSPKIPNSLEQSNESIKTHPSVVPINQTHIVEPGGQVVNLEEKAQNEVAALYTPEENPNPPIILEIKSKDVPAPPKQPIGKYTRFYMKIRLNGTELNALVDGGAERSYFGYKAAELVAPHIKSQKTTFKGVTGAVDEAWGIVTVDMTVDGLKKEFTLKVANNFGYDCILGMDFLTEFKIVIDNATKQWVGANGNAYDWDEKPRSPNPLDPEEHPVAGLQELEDYEQQKLDELIDRLFLEKPIKIFDLVNHKIDVQNHEPIRQRVRRYSPKMMEIAYKQLDSYLEQGFIEESTSPWRSSFVIGTRQNGEPRFCIDYRDVNKITKKDAYNIPHMDSILDRLRKAKYVSTIDLRNAYHHIPLEESSKEITAFYVPGRGLFQFRKLPFGLTNSAPAFQRVMDHLIEPGWDNVFTYLDDVIIATETFEDHLKWLEKVITKLHAAGLTINREKSSFGCKEVKYLGYVLSKEGLKIDWDKIKPIVDYPAPTNIKQLRRFLGMIGWYSRFIENFATIKVPLTNLLHKDCKWHWGPEQQDSFENLKLAITKAPVLVRPDFTLPFQIHADASNFAVGAVLTQVQNGEEHPICFTSRVLSKAERNYTVTEKECLAVIAAVEKMRPYVQGYHFTVITDHASLKWLNNLKDPSGRLARWATKLQAYDFEIVHRRGVEHKVPDALSRAMENQVADLIAAAEETLPIAPDWYHQKKEQVQNQPHKFPDWYVKENLMYVHRPNSWIDPIIEDLEAWKLVVPEHLKERVLHDAHDTPEAGHMGIDKTYHRLQLYYYWPGMYKDVVEYVKSCSDCQLVKVPRELPCGQMGYRYIDGPWTNVSGDIMGPFPASYNQDKYLIVFVDRFTKYVEMKALQQANAQTVLKAFEELIINRWGCPKYLLSDNGSEFFNHVVTERLKTYGIEQDRTPVYHAQANPTERYNQTIKTMIRIFVNKDHRTWDIHLNEFAFAINTAIHASTKYSPAFLNFGRNPLSPHCLQNQLPVPVQTKSMSKDVWIDRVKRLSAIRDIVKKHVDLAYTRQAKYYDKHHLATSYSVGDKVLRRTHYLSKGDKYFSAKLAEPFRGPCLIENKISDLVFEVLDLVDGTRHKLHISHLKPFIEQETEEKIVSGDHASSPIQRGPRRVEELRPSQKRGRPPKSKIPSPMQEKPKRRGRPPKNRPSSIPREMPNERHESEPESRVEESREASFRSEPESEPAKESQNRPKSRIPVFRRRNSNEKTNSAEKTDKETGKTLRSSSHNGTLESNPKRAIRPKDNRITPISPRRPLTRARAKLAQIRNGV